MSDSKWKWIRKQMWSRGLGLGFTSVDCEAAEWCWPFTLCCHFMFFCVLKSNSAKKSESDQLFCAQETLHKAQPINMQEARCYLVLSASCKLLGVDNRSACHRTCSRDYSIQVFLQTFFTGVVWSEVIHNHIISFIIYYSGRICALTHHLAIVTKACESSTKHYSEFSSLYKTLSWAQHNSYSWLKAK